MRYREPFLLSSAGSTRATAYVFSNKVVMLDGKIHVAWLDAVAGVRSRTFDRASETWSETFELFDGSDNHTTPALTADRDGHVRMLFGPHGWWNGWNQARFMHTVSEQPNAVDAWTEPVSFGYDATYASIAHTPAGLDAVAYRGGEPPCAVMFQRQRKLGGWTHAMPLMHQKIRPQYTHVGAHVISASDGTLYVGGHFYNLDDGVSAGVALLMSRDSGATWSDMGGEPAWTPIRYAKRFAVPHPPEAYFCGMAVDGNDVLHVLAAAPRTSSTELLLSRREDDAWRTVDAAAFLPDGWNADMATMCIDMRGRVHIVCSAVPSPWPERDRLWGHPSHEIFHLLSDDGGATFVCAQVSPPDPEVSNWLPAVSQGGLFHPVETPVILWTKGGPGEGCTPEDTTEVWCVVAEEDA